MIKAYCPQCNLQLRTTRTAEGRIYIEHPIHGLWEKDCTRLPGSMFESLASGYTDDVHTELLVRKLARAHPELIKLEPALVQLFG